MMKSNFMKDLLQQMVDQGVLTGEIYWQGELIKPTEDGIWRPDGHSIETNRGCRKIRAVEDLREQFASGDDAERLVAERFPSWWCYDPMQLVGARTPEEWRKGDQVSDLEADNREERLIAGTAVSAQRTLHHMLLIRDDTHYRFIAREDTDGDGVREQTVPPTHRVVMSGRLLPAEEIYERWPQRAADLMVQMVQALRNPGQSEWDR